MSKKLTAKLKPSEWQMARANLALCGLENSGRGVRAVDKLHELLDSECFWGLDLENVECVLRLVEAWASYDLDASDPQAARRYALTEMANLVARAKGQAL